MTLTELRYIVAVAREGHFGRAAEACFVSPPTLSLGVKKLEEELGIVIFERGHQEVIVTPVGKSVVEQAARVLEAANAVKKVVQQGEDPLEGVLRIGAIHTVGPYLFPSLLTTIKERAPKLRLFVEEDHRASLTERLRSGELDVILVSLPYGEPGVETQALYEEPFVVLLPVSHPWSDKAAVELQDLQKETVLLLARGHCFRKQVLDLCKSFATSSSALPGAVEGGSLETIRYMVAGGVGVAVVPCAAAGADRFSQRMVTIRRFADATPSRRIAIAWRKTFPRMQAVRLVVEAIRSYPMSCVRMLGEKNDHTRVSYDETLV